jgi:hypothetical protein
MTSRARAGSSSSVLVNEVHLRDHIKVPLELLHVFHELRNDYAIQIRLPIKN